jgi:prepilin-type N-terminal cleavage/methylation domain-containing protein
MNKNEMTLRKRIAFTGCRNEIPSASFAKEGTFEASTCGFTLVEVIVTIVATAILGVIFVNFMGTAMSRSTRSVLNVEAEANAQALMEQIVADYTVEINKADPSGALSTIFNKPYGSTVSKQYITFNSSGDQVVSGNSTDTLKITVVWDAPDAPDVRGTAITTLLTNSRRNMGDPPVAF